MTQRIALVVHGVANRSADDFKATVQRLQHRAGDGWRLLEVYWGDLGGVSEGLADSLPAVLPAEDTTRGPAEDTVPELLALLQGLPAQAVPPPPGGVTRGLSPAPDAVETLVRKTLGQVPVPAAGVDTSGPTRGGVPAGAPGGGLADELRAALRNSTHLKQTLDPQVQDAAAGLLAQALQASAEAAPQGPVTRGLLSDAGKAVREAVARIDTIIGRVSANVAGGAQQWIRARLAEPVALTLGDIVAYHQHRESIHARLFQALDDLAPGWGTAQQPVTVLAHSLGGLAVFDAAIQGLAQADGTPRHLHIDHLVTFGSQPAFFHVLAPRVGLAAYRPGHPVPLPDRIRRWTNLWHPLDVLAFSAGTVFRQSDGKKPLDRPVDTPASAIAAQAGWLHSCYWDSSALTDALRDT